MHGTTRRCVVGACLVAALVFGAIREAAAQQAVPPEGKKPWTLDAAARDVTPTRDRVSMLGLWRWQPAEASADKVPADGWGFLEVPMSWPRGGGEPQATRGGRGPRREGSEAFAKHPNWKDRNLSGLTAAWYQVDVQIPAEWKGRRIALSTEYLQSFAAVYVDGKKVGVMRFPGGEVDLTAQCRPGVKHELSLLAVAMPLNAVMASFNDTDLSKEIKSEMRLRGLCGNVFLTAMPQGPRINNLRVVTSVRKGQITLDAALDGIDPTATYAFQARIKDKDRIVKEYTSKTFKGSDLVDGRAAVAEDWLPEKLWDIHTPQNQYDIDVSLVGADGKVLDTILPERFGFREFWIDGRDFYLNGSRIFLSFSRGQPGFNYESTIERLKELRKVGINFVAVGGFGCEPGNHSPQEEVLRAADDFGALIALTQPHTGQYNWKLPDADKENGYAAHAEFYTRVAGNHPSVVFYAANHNATGYSEDMNPDLIDGLVDRSKWSRGSNVPNALRGEAIVKRLDPTRIYYHHSSGNLGPMHTSNFYANWAPIQEMSDWFEHWATVGVKPMHPCEYGTPLSWDWSMYRGWYKGKREYGSASVPWELCLAEWGAPFYGPEAYKITERDAQNIRWEAGKFRAGQVWKRWDYPGGYDLNFPHPERDPIMAAYFAENTRAFRTWGLSVTAPEGYRGPLSTAALVRNNGPLLAYIAGKPEAFTSKDHNFLPGESFQKQIIVINNSRVTTTAACQWKLDLPKALSGNKSVKVPTGQQERIPLDFQLPADLAPGQYKLTATIQFGNGEVQEDEFLVDVLAPPKPVGSLGRVAVFDPVGDTSKLLKSLGVEFTAVDADAKLDGYDLFLVGKGVLTADGPAPDISRVRNGLKVVLFEQTVDALEKRFGFRTQEYGLRKVFRRVADHPILNGIADANLHDWRGDATITAPRLKYQISSKFGAPTIQWAGIPVTRVWRCGNRGNVASALIEKPAAGDFTCILDGGYALQYASLLEYREGKGMVLFCQTDLCGRTANDPVAEKLAGNLLRYAADWKPAPRRSVLYAGESAGKKYLESAGVQVVDYKPGTLAPETVLVVGPGAEKLAAQAVGAVRAGFGDRTG